MTEKLILINFDAWKSPYFLIFPFFEIFRGGFCPLAPPPWRRPCIEYFTFQIVRLNPYTESHFLACSASTSLFQVCRRNRSKPNILNLSFLSILLAWVAALRPEYSLKEAIYHLSFGGIHWQRQEVIWYTWLNQWMIGVCMLAAVTV